MSEQRDPLDDKVGAILSGTTKPDQPAQAPSVGSTDPQPDPGAMAAPDPADADNEDAEQAPETETASAGSKPFYVGLDFAQHLGDVWDRVQWADFFLLYSKVLNEDDIGLCNEAAKALGVIFEINTNDMQKDGAAHAELFLKQMTALGVRPKPRSAVFVAADIDLTAPTQVTQAINHLLAFARTVGPEGWTLGSYGNGALELTLAKEADINVIGWSAGAKGWYNTRIYDGSGLWTVNQGPTFTHGGVWPQPGALRVRPGGSTVAPQSWPNIGVPYDPDIAINLDWAI